MECELIQKVNKMSEKLQRLLNSVKKVVLEKSSERINGKVSSLRTQEIAEQVMANCAKRLHKLGFYLESVDGLSRKHIDALVQDWYNGDKLSAKTIQNQFSRLKIFCGWIGKAGIISPQGAIGHLPGVEAAELKVSTVAKKSKSWSANGIDVQQKIREAIANDVRHGAMLLMAVAFGLRKKEQLKIQLLKADKGTHLEIDGSVGKNGKFRAIPLECGTPELDEFGAGQRWALNEAKKVCKRNETLGWPELTYKQSENRYYGYMRKLGLTKFDEGVTAHGLRAEYAENMLILRGLIPPSLGGNGAQMPKTSETSFCKKRPTGWGTTIFTPAQPTLRPSKILIQQETWAAKSAESLWWIQKKIISQCCTPIRCPNQRWTEHMQSCRRQPCQGR